MPVLVRLGFTDLPADMKNSRIIYRDSFLQAKILETLLMNDQIKLDDLLGAITARIRENHLMMWTITMPDIGRQVVYLEKLGMLEVNVENKSVRIEERGVETLRNGTFQNVSSAAFSSYETLRLASLALYVSIAAATISIIALFGR